MKMILPLITTRPGRLIHLCKPGTVNAGDQIAKLMIETDNGVGPIATCESRELNITKFAGNFEEAQNAFLAFKDQKEKANRRRNMIAKTDRLSTVQSKNELMCAKNNTTYCYNFPKMFRPMKFNEIELVDGKIVPVRSSRKSRPIAMVAWEIVLQSGKTIVVISNDLTVDYGTFSFPEEEFFCAISRYCRSNKLPFVFIACNSGAKLHFRDNLMEKVKIKLNEKKDVDYLYLLEEDYQTYREVVDVEYIESLEHYKLNYVINWGTKNLDGSGLIASEMSKAYDEIFTISLVSGRSIGIGSYLQKLGQRIIQKVDSPMILTGFNASNNVLGKNVYNSNLELGGPSVMANNGNSHLL